MKKNYLLLPFCLLAFAYRIHAQEGWSKLSIDIPSIDDSRIDDIYFINPDTGWAAGTSAIRKTTDGGQIWEVQYYSLGSYLRSIEFLDPYIGFCGTLDGEFLKTTDGGETWVDIAADVPGSIPGICGLSHHGQNVYGCGFWSSPAYFIKSHDAGDTWEYKEMSEYAIALVDAVFFHPDSGFVCGQSAVGGTVLFTVDGGETWEEVHNTNVPGEKVWKLQMLSRDTLFASVENFATGTILVSHDGGKNWITKQFDYSGDIQAIGFISGSRGWVGGYFDGFHETNDGGNTWQNIGIGYKVNRIFALSPELAYASGASVYKFIGPPVGPTAVEGNALKPDLDWQVSTDEGGKSVSIRLRLHRTNNVNIGLYALDGRLLRNLFNGRLPSGEHGFEESLDVPQGAYLVGLQINEGLSARKIVIH